MNFGEFEHSFWDVGCCCYGFQRLIHHVVLCKNQALRSERGQVGGNMTTIHVVDGPNDAVAQKLGLLFAKKGKTNRTNVRIFLLQESFSPTKQTQRNSNNIKSPKKKKSAFFLHLLLG